MWPAGTRLSEARSLTLYLGHLDSPDASLETESMALSPVGAESTLLSSSNNNGSSSSSFISFLLPSSPFFSFLLQSSMTRMLKPDVTLVDHVPNLHMIADKQ